MASHEAFFSFAVLVLASSFQICLADCDALLARIEALEIQGSVELPVSVTLRLSTDVALLNKRYI